MLFYISIFLLNIFFSFQIIFGIRFCFKNLFPPFALKRFEKFENNHAEVCILKKQSNVRGLHQLAMKQNWLID